MDSSGKLNGTFDRIMIIGCCGSGKSTLSRQLQAVTGLPLVHLDHEYYGPGWQEKDTTTWRQDVSRLAAGNRWIIDGNYISSMEVRIARADLVIFLDIGRITCLMRAFGRAADGKKRHRSDMGEGCFERHDLAFYRFVWNFRRTTYTRITALFEHYNTVPVLRVRSRKDIRRLLLSFSKKEQIV